MKHSPSIISLFFSPFVRGVCLQLRYGTVGSARAGDGRGADAGIGCLQLRVAPAREMNGSPFFKPMKQKVIWFVFWNISITSYQNILLSPYWLISFVSPISTLSFFKKKKSRAMGTGDMEDALLTRGSIGRGHPQQISQVDAAVSCFCGAWLSKKKSKEETKTEVNL